MIVAKAIETRWLILCDKPYFIGPHVQLLVLLCKLKCPFSARYGTVRYGTVRIKSFHFYLKQAIVCTDSKQAVCYCMY